MFSLESKMRNIPISCRRTFCTCIGLTARRAPTVSNPNFMPKLHLQFVMAVPILNPDDKKFPASAPR